MGLQSSRIILHDDSGTLRRRKVVRPSGSGVLPSFKTILHDNSRFLHLGRICLRCCWVCLRDRRVALHDERASRSSCRDTLQSHNPSLHECRESLRCDGETPHRRRESLRCDGETPHRRRERLRGDGETPLHRRDEWIFHHRSLHDRRQTTHSFLIMATWNSNVLWNSGALWGPGSSQPPSYQPKRKRSTMKRQPYFPRTTGLRPEWFHNYATELPAANDTLDMPPTEVAATVADARFCEYATGAWLTAVREFGPAATSSVESLLNDPGASPHVLSIFTPPPLPQGDPTATLPIPATVPVPPGALQRIFTFVKAIKARPGYTEAIGLQLGLVGEEDTTTNPLPTFSLKAERGGGCECVKIIFKKYGRQGVVIYGRRGGGDWELLAIDLASPYMDERPLLNAGQPELREYRLQFYDDAAPVGDFTGILGITVNP